MRKPEPPPSSLPPHAGFLRRLMVGGFWTTVDAWATEAANLVVFLVLVRLLAPSEFGIVAMAAVFVMLASDLGAFSVTQVLIQRRDLQRGHVDAVFLTVLGLSVVGFALVLAGAPLAAAVYGEPLVAELLVWLSPVIVLNAFTAVPIALLTRDMRFGTLAMRSFAMVVTSGAVGVSLAVLGYGPWALVAQALTKSAVSLVVLMGATGWRPGWRCGRGHLRDVRGYVLGTFGTHVVGAAERHVVQFLLGLLLGSAALGYFNAAQRLVEILVRLFIVPVSQLTMPGFSTVQADPARVRALLEGGVRVTSLISFPAFVGAAVVAPDLVGVVLGETWLPAAPVLAILALRGLGSTSALPGASLLYALGRPHWLLGINAASLAAGTVVLLVAAPFGVAAAAAGDLLRFLGCHCSLIAVAVGRLTGVRPTEQVRLVLPSLAAAAFMAACVLAWRSFGPATDPATSLASSVAVGVVAYALASLVVNRALLRRAAGLVLGVGGAARA
ncbi:oligosaccharide flippase family protein [Arenibaculum sp.]|jgi:PST family polysaccharide transporter|uniref:oligosaccharide flippase family protein n=1 Tax=Arenibaculum sp. TaxID=2865862 RepID=UPI002E0DE7AE|nr:oligosaccharide flippase family protein [Arenibaculum sp.]